MGSISCLPLVVRNGFQASRRGGSLLWTKPLKGIPRGEASQVTRELKTRLAGSKGWQLSAIPVFLVVAHGRAEGLANFRTSSESNHRRTWQAGRDFEALLCSFLVLTFGISRETICLESVFGKNAHHFSKS